MKDYLPEQVLVTDASSLQAEAYQRIQVNIEYAGIDKKIKCFGVISSNQNEGKSTTSCNLAKIYAMKGIKTCIVDLDLRKPTVHRLLKVSNDLGITDFVLGKASKKQIIKTVDGLDVITAGSKTSFPTNVLQSESLLKLIEELKEEYEYVIIDTPPILVVADGIIISRFVDGFINVCVSTKTKKSDLRESMKIFEQNNINVIGIVLTRVKITRKAYASYRYYSE